MEIFNTHKFLFTLNYENKIKGHKVTFIDRDDKEKTIVLNRIEIGTSTVTCKLFDDENNRYIVPFIKVREVHTLDGELIWDSKEIDLGNVRVIKGFEKKKRE